MPDQQIDVPGVGMVSFPDTMSDEDIIAAVKKLSAGTSQTTKPPEQRGILRRFIAGTPLDYSVSNVEEGAKNYQTGNYKGLAKNVLQAIYPPAAAADQATGMIRNSIEHGKKMLNAGSHGEAAKEAVYALPLVGGMIEQPVENIRSGNYAGLAGNAATLAAPFAGPKVAGMAKGAANVASDASAWAGGFSNPESLPIARRMIMSQGKPTGTPVASINDAFHVVAHPAIGAAFVGTKLFGKSRLAAAAEARSQNQLLRTPLEDPGHSFAPPLEKAYGAGNPRPSMMDLRGDTQDYVPPEQPDIVPDMEGARAQLQANRIARSPASTLMTRFAEPAATPEAAPAAEATPHQQVLNAIEKNGIGMTENNLKTAVPSVTPEVLADLVKNNQIYIRDGRVVLHPNRAGSTPSVPIMEQFNRDTRANMIAGALKEHAQKFGYTTADLAQLIEQQPGRVSELIQDISRTPQGTRIGTYWRPSTPGASPLTEAMVLKKLKGMAVAEKTAQPKAPFVDNTDYSDLFQKSVDAIKAKKQQ